MELFIGLGILLIVIVIFGALAGGESFGDTIRKGFNKGCGCLATILIIIVIFIIAVTIFYTSDTKKDSTPKETVSSSNDYAYFIIKKDCATYTKPDKSSEISEYLKAGQELYIENLNKFNYFYEVKWPNGRKSYILKGNLRRKIE